MDIADEILDWLYAGKSLSAYCAQEGKPSRRTVYKWCEKEPDFESQFARAREVGAGVLIDQAQDVADDGSNDTYTDDEGKQRTDFDVVARSKLRVDTLFKRAACYCPRLYGTKVALGGDASAPAIKVEQQGPAPVPTVDLATQMLRAAEIAREVMQKVHAEDPTEG